MTSVNSITRPNGGVVDLAKPKHQNLAEASLKGRKFAPEKY